MSAQSVKRRLAVLLLTPVLVFGCGGFENPAPDTAAVATFVRSPYGGGQQTFSIVKDARCTGSRIGKVVAMLGLMFSRSSVGPVKLETGQITYFRARDKGVRYPMTTRCTNIVSIVPEAGHHYEFSQRVNINMCELEITDSASGARPASYTAYPTTGSCL
jgi:hypothetical protein